MLVIELDTVKKTRGRHEWRPVNRARFRDIEEVGDGFILTKLMARILELEPTQNRSLVYVYRDGTLCFNPIPLEDWLKKKEQPPQLKKVRATP